MSQKKLLVVVGATGVQGSSVINHFFHHEPSYTLRGLTRNTSSHKAQALATKGVEMVQANLNDTASIISAFDGAHAIFAYTDHSYSSEAEALVTSGSQPSIAAAAGAIEISQGKTITDIASSVPTLERLIWSATPSSKLRSNGKFNEIYELDAKAEVTSYLYSHAGLKNKVSTVNPSVFADVPVRFPMLLGSFTRTSDKVYTLRNPYTMTSPVPWIVMSADFGSYVAALLHAPQAGINVAAISGYLSYGDVINIMEEKLGVEIVHEKVSEEVMLREAGDDLGGLIKEAVELMQFVEGLDFETPRELEGREPRIMGREEFEGLTGVRVGRGKGDVGEVMRGLDWGMLLKD